MSDNATQRGRQSTYTEEVAAAVLGKIAEGRSLRSIGRDPGMPAAGTVVGWANDNREGFAERYARALAVRAELMFEEMLEIADDGTGDTYVDEEGETRVNFDHIQRSKLRVDTRKWALAKMLPKKFGDSSTLELTGGDNPVKMIVEFVDPPDAGK